MPERGTCPVCGRTRWLLYGRLGLHQGLAANICAGSGRLPWTAGEKAATS